MKAIIAILIASLAAVGIYLWRAYEKHIEESAPTETDAVLEDLDQS